ncbi:DDE-type integrase/transposase/recombinase [Pseudoalteromonas sp. APC 3224]|uniref:DDE-type integrase/transposase/recombinase n=1 Tax=Pseudoalteromonas sp. APC 3224 TaxID=3035203 RepID=UPI0025B54E69|nr:DDE-type integrase/transposase/recombinase [Pseudoalteromonas sp. APC 3224]MDN3484459.1 DDE-type integrase/transposase/recombinase [Pseudoalteromonas sp. APC 3224]
MRQNWAGDVTYLRIDEGWMYLAIVMDLYSRHIIGWYIDKGLTTDLVSKAMMKAYNLRQPSKDLVFHSDRGSQYTSKHYRKLSANNSDSEYERCRRLLIWCCC